MRCAILVEPKHIEVREVAQPKPAAGGIVVRVRCALTDGTDLKAYRRGHPKMTMPTPFGHEFSGDVAAVAPDVTTFHAGDAVMCVHSAPCYHCYWCERGEFELCESIMETMILGAYAEFIEIPARIVKHNCYLKPLHLSYTAAAFLEPLSCVVHSLDFLNVSEGSTVVVLGDGGFGIMHAALLRRRGAKALLAGRRGERLALGQRFGVEQTVNTRQGSLRDAVRELTKGRGADAVIECTGNAEVWEAAPGLVRRGGIVSFFGGLPSGTNVSFPAARLHYDEVRLISPFHFRPASVLRAYQMLVSGEFDPQPLITATVPLAEISAVFERLDGGEGIKFAIEA